MLKKSNIIKISLILSLFFLFSCKSATDPVSGERVNQEFDPNKKAREYADKGGGIFGDINNKKAPATTYEFSSSNVLWKATLKTLEFLPLINADYSGGVIIYDWYADKLNSKEQIKVTVRFLNNELRTDSIQVITHKKICENSEKCYVSKLDENFSKEIKDSILTIARALKIEEAKKEPK